MPLFPYLGQSIESIEKNDAIFLIGSDVRLEQPMLAHRIRQASARGCKLTSLNPQSFNFHIINQSTWNVAPQQWMLALAEIAKCAQPEALQKLPPALNAIVEKTTISTQAKEIFDLLNNAEQTSILLGAIMEGHPQASTLRALANFIASNTNSHFGIIAQAGNSVGAWLSGVVPHRLPAGKASSNMGLNAAEMLAKPRKVYVLFNLEPEFDFANAPAAIKAMQEAEFVVIFSPYLTESMLDYANAILPIATFAETDGTYVNAEGHWQSVTNAISVSEEVRPAWRVLRVLANKLGIADTQYQSCSQIRDEIKSLLGGEVEFDSNLKDLNHINLNSDEGSLFRVSSTPIYAVDNVVRRASSLQNTVHEQQPHVAMCEQQASELGVLKETKVRVVQGSNEATLDLQLNEAIPMQCVWVQKSAEQVDQLGEAIAPVEIQRLVHA